MVDYLTDLDPNILDRIPQISADKQGFISLKPEALTHSRIITPHEALNWWLTSRAEISDIQIKLRQALRLFLNLGIPYEDIGIYGGLQNFLVHWPFNHKQPIKDIDFVIRGTQYTERLIQLAVRSQRYKTHFPKNSYKSGRVRATHASIRKYRHFISRIYTPYGFFIDVKIRRHPNNKNTPELFRRATTGINIATLPQLTVRGVVIEDREVLCLDPSITIGTSSTRQYHLISAVPYHLSGMARKGKFLEISGRVFGDFIYVEDPHSITYLNQL